jgi:hypothetical protein
MGPEQTTAPEEEIAKTSTPAAPEQPSATFHERPQNLDTAGIFMDSLDGVLAYRPQPFQVHIIKEIDKDLDVVKRDTRPNDVERILERFRQNGHRIREAQSTVLPILVGGTYLQQLLWEKYNGNPYNQPNAPQDESSNFEIERKYDRDYATAFQAAQRAQDELPSDAPAEIRESVNHQVELAGKNLNRIMAAEGRERTALVFGDAEANQDFTENATNFLNKLEGNEGKITGRDELMALIRLHDFMNQHFAWVKDYGVASRNFHSSAVNQKSQPLLAIAQRYYEMQQKYPNMREIDTSLTHILQQQRESGTYVYPGSTVSEARKEFTDRMRDQWQKRLLRTAGLVRTSFESIARTNNFNSEQLREIKNEILWNAAGGEPVSLTPQQRHEMDRSLSMWLKRAQATHMYMESTYQRSVQTGQPKEAVIIGDLFNVTLDSPVTIQENPLAIEIHPTTGEDYEKLWPEFGAESGGFASRKTVNGVDIPVIVIKPTLNSPSFEYSVKQHESSHVAYQTKSDQPRQFDFAETDSFFYDHDTNQQNKLGFAVERYALESAKDEMVAYLVGGNSFTDIRNFLTESHLYDYLQNHRGNWGLGDPRFDSMIQDAQTKYHGRVEQAVKTAQMIQQYHGLYDNKNLAALLAILPMDQWKHMLPRGTKV